MALVVLLKCYQRLGYFPKLVDVPSAVIDYVRAKLELDEAVEAGYEPSETGGSYQISEDSTRHRPRKSGAVSTKTVAPVRSGRSASVGARTGTGAVPRWSAG